MLSTSFRTDHSKKINYVGILSKHTKNSLTKTLHFLKRKNTSSRDVVSLPFVHLLQQQKLKHNVKQRMLLSCCVENAKEQMRAEEDSVKSAAVKRTKTMYSGAIANTLAIY